MNNKWITLKTFIPQNRLIDVALKHCFEVTLPDFEQIINYDFGQLEGELLNDISFFHWMTFFFLGSQTKLV